MLRFRAGAVCAAHDREARDGELDVRLDLDAAGVQPHERTMSVRANPLSMEAGCVSPVCHDGAEIRRR
jgi:hypothetical protein